MSWLCCVTKSSILSLVEHHRVMGLRRQVKWEYEFEIFPHLLDNPCFCLLLFWNCKLQNHLKNLGLKHHLSICLALQGYYIPTWNCYRFRSKIRFRKSLGLSLSQLKKWANKCSYDSKFLRSWISKVWIINISFWNRKFHFFS